VTGEPCILGCPETRVFLMDHCGTRTVGDITDAVTFVKWGRELDEDSEAEVTLHLRGDAAGRACCEFLGNARTWRNELMVVRGGEVVWGPGPLVTISIQRHIAHLTARDIFAWLDRRLVHEEYEFKEVELSELARIIVYDALTKGDAADMPAQTRDACILDYAEFHDTGRLTDMQILANRKSAGAVLRELGAQGLDFTVVNRRLIVGADFAFGPIGPLHDEHIAENVAVDEHGLQAATKWYVSSDTEAVQGQAGGVDPYFGLIEQGVEGQSVSTSQKDLDRLARDRLTTTNPPPLIVKIPQPGRLTPDAPVCPRVLVPGTMVDFSIRELCRPAVVRQRLTSLRVTVDDKDESFGITTAPLGLLSEEEGGTA
jgi:hypothetical protein